MRSAARRPSVIRIGQVLAGLALWNEVIIQVLEIPTAATRGEDSYADSHVLGDEVSVNRRAFWGRVPFYSSISEIFSQAGNI